MKRRVIVVSSCAPPLPGHPVTGGGLRTQQLVQTLEQAGHQVFLMVEAAALPDDAPATMQRKAFAPDDLLEQVRARRPSVVVVEQWAMAALLEGLDKPVAVDLHGSLLLENVYRRGELDLTLDVGAKIKALRAADLLLAPSTAQLSWFASWAAIAGFDPREPPLALMPLAMPGEPPPPRDKETPYLRMVYGGARWPWIDSLEALTVAADVAEDVYGGRLNVFAFDPPRHGLPVDEELGTWPQVDAALTGRRKKGIRLHGGVPHADFAAFLSKEATVALDLWKPNPERLLAATTRTVEYLWHGLPVVTVEGAEWAEALLATGAGWVIPPDDSEALEALLRGLAEEPERIAQASAAATAMAAQRHTLEAAGQALLDFVRKPVCPPRTANSLTGLVIAEREAHFDVALREQHTHLLTAHEARADELRRFHQREVSELSDRHRALVDEVTERHRVLVEGLTDKHRGELAENLVERQREVSKMLIHWQGELDKAHDGVVQGDARNRAELEEAEARHRAERQADEERHRAELETLDLTLKEQHAHLLTAHETRADELRRFHRREVSELSDRHRALVDEVTERHRVLVEGLTDKHREELAETLVERQREVDKMLIQWQSELDKAHDGLVQGDARHRAELEELEAQHRAERQADEERRRVELETLAERSRAELREARDEHRQELTQADTGRSGALEQVEARHRLELAELVETHRAEGRATAAENKAERRHEQNRHRAELEAVVGKQRAEMEAARTERDAQVRELVDEWSGKAATLQREATEARDQRGDAQERLRDAQERLRDAQERLRGSEHRHTEQVARLEVERAALKVQLDEARAALEALKVQLDEARAALEALQARRRNRLPRVPSGPGQAVRLAKLWVSHVLDRDD